MRTSRIAAIKSEVAAGRRMNGPDRLMGSYSHLRLGAPLIRQNDFRMILQFVEAAGGHDVAWMNAFHGCHNRIFSSRIDRLHGGGAVADYIEEGPLSVVLNGIGGN